MLVAKGRRHEPGKKCSSPKGEDMNQEKNARRQRAKTQTRKKNARRRRAKTRIRKKMLVAKGRRHEQEKKRSSPKGEDMNQEKLGLLLIVASHFDSRTDVLKTLNGMTPGVDNLITINNTSQHKVEYRLGPQRTIFGQDVGKSAAH